MSWTEIPRETIDYTHTVNRALQAVFDARSQVHDSFSYERYLKAVEALYIILLPSLRPPDVEELLKEASRRDPEYGYYTVSGLSKLDRAVTSIVSRLDESGLLMKKKQVLTGGEIDA